MATKVDVKALLAAGAHFGHKTSRWHPKMAPYIHSAKSGTHIIDLIQTGEKLEEALQLIEKTVADSKQVLLVGTKKQASALVEKISEETNQPAVYNRWLGGLLTNSKTMKTRIKKLKQLESQMESGELAQKYNKLEVQRFQEEIDRLNYNFKGIKDMHQKPGVVFVTDIITDKLAVEEAKTLGIPVVGLVDTNADPTSVEYPVPCNDDAIKTLEVVLNYVKEAIAAGKAKQKKGE